MNYALFPVWRALNEHHEYKGYLKADKFIRLLDACENIRSDIKFNLKGEIDSEQHKALVGQIEVTVDLVCQRCMEVYSQTFVLPVHWVPVRTEDGLEQIGNDDIALLVTEETMNLVELIEEELLLALPMIPYHADDQNCEGRVYLEQQVAVVDEKINPFATLSDLLKK